MDNFMEKLAQKFSAQEMIKANSQAEAEEMKRLKLQVSEYEKILQEMRKLNYKNAELSGKLDLMIGDNAKKIQSMKEDEMQFIALLRDLTDEQTRNREAELERKEEERLERERADEAQKESDITAITGFLEDKFQYSNEFVHKENVKVYRNVQAAVSDEIKRCIDSIQNERNELKNELISGLKSELVSELRSELINEIKNEQGAKLNKVMLCSLISMAASVLSVILWALVAYGVIG